MNKWIGRFAIVASAAFLAPVLAGDDAAACQNALQSASVSFLRYLDDFKFPVMFFLGLLAFRFR
jgi:hypothetical protein